MEKNIFIDNEIKILLKQKKYDEAERILEVITYLDKNSIALNILGLLNYRKGFYKKSQQYFVESYKIDNNKDAHYYLDVLFENNKVFSEYYRALKLCKNRRYEDAETILEKITSIKQAKIIFFIIKYMKGSLFERRKILKKESNAIFKGDKLIKMYNLMKMNYRSRLRRIVLYFLFLIVLFSGAAMLLV